MKNEWLKYKEECGGKLYSKSPTSCTGNLMKIGATSSLDICVVRINRCKLVDSIDLVSSVTPNHIASHCIESPNMFLKIINVCATLIGRNAGLACIIL